MSAEIENNYFNVTERPGHNATKDQLSMMITRYNLATKYIKNKRVVEIASGAGMGLGYLKNHASYVAGGDIDQKLVDIAEDTYKDNEDIEVCQLDAHDLPYEKDSFDVVLMYEAIYYIADIDKFLSEVARVLDKDGVFIISSVNPQWHSFNSSPHSIKYYNNQELIDLLSKYDFNTESKVGFYDRPAGAGKITTFLRQIAVSLNLIPKTMAGKERLKRIFYGKLSPIPNIISEKVANIEPLIDVTNETELDLSNYKFIYVLGFKNMKS